MTTVKRGQVAHEFEDRQPAFDDRIVGAGGGHIRGFHPHGRAVDLDDIARAGAQKPQLLTQRAQLVRDPVFHFEGPLFQGMFDQLAVAFDQGLKLLRHGLGEGAGLVKLGGDGSRRGGGQLGHGLNLLLQLLQPLRIGPCLRLHFGLVGQFDKDLHLGLQDFRHERLDQIIHRAERVAPHNHFLCFHLGCQKNDGGQLRGFPRPDHLGGFETIEARHLHIEQDHRKVPDEQFTQGLATGIGFHQFILQPVEQRLQALEVGRHIVHQ